ncbi:MAG: efflux RND transporter periplasmic adaptor subunit [Myxococcota bacterium]
MNFMKMLGVSCLALASALALTLPIGCQDSGAMNEPVTRSDSAERLRARLRVRVAPVRLARLAGSDRVTGTIRAFRRAAVMAETQGRVVARGVEPGAAVKKGQLIVELESSRARLELRRTEASLQAKRTVLAHAEREFARAERLRAQNALSTQAYDDLRNAVERAGDDLSLAKVARDTARRNLQDARIAAPFDGTVDSFAVNAGDFVAPGTPVATVVDLSRIRIYAGVTAQEAARLTPEMAARVSVSDLGGEIFDVTLKSVSRVATDSDGTYQIELWMDDPEGRMRDGLVAKIDLPDPDETLKLLAPRSALLRRDGHPEVFVIERAGEELVARARRLRTGRSQGEFVEILDGLSEGDAVVFDGHFALQDGAVVEVDGGFAEEGAAAVPSGSPAPSEAAPEAVSAAAVDAASAPEPVAAATPSSLAGSEASVPAPASVKVE